LIVRGADPTFTRVDDELIGLDTRSGLAHSLNPPAARVWALIERPATIAEVCERLVEEYDVDVDTCMEQVVALVADLEQAGLVEVTAGSQA
jgi:PqqD family protein of HPr-rel-A system